MNLKKAQVLARAVVLQLEPHCERIAIAGSIRRESPEVGDIEIVAIPKTIPADLFLDERETIPDFCAVVNQWQKIKGEPTGRYTQRQLPGIRLDLFLATADNWGLIYAIRTGSAAWVRTRLAARWVARGYTSIAGILYRDGEAFDSPEEEDVFRRLNMEYIAPQLRECGPTTGKAGKW